MRGMIRAGCDEVGRGALFGPLITCAVIFPEGGLSPSLAQRLADSKTLSARTREDISEQLLPQVIYAFGCASAREVDLINPLKATMLAMSRAVARLPQRPDWLMIDGISFPDTGIPGETIIKGDSLIPEISAAAILAKVLRDRQVAKLSSIYPGYGLDRHSGYGTKAHFDAIEAMGATPHHRLSFLRKRFAGRFDRQDLNDAGHASQQPAVLSPNEFELPLFGETDGPHRPG